jgi:hypothetical protein
MMMAQSPCLFQRQETLAPRAGANRWTIACQETFWGRMAMSVFRSVRFSFVVAALTAANSLLALAADPNADNASPGAAKKKDAAPPARDPTASAFTLPRGVTLTPAQQAAYDQLKEEKAPELQQAIDDLQSSNGNTTAQAMKKVRDLRAEIRKKVNDIAYSNDAGAQNPGQDAQAGSEPSYAASPYSVGIGGVPFAYGGYPLAYGGYYPYFYGGYQPYGDYNSYPYGRDFGRNRNWRNYYGDYQSPYGGNVLNSRPINSSPINSAPINSAPINRGRSGDARFSGNANAGNQARNFSRPMPSVRPSSAPSSGGGGRKH